MDLILSTTVGIATLLILISMVIWSSRFNTAQSLSLPSVFSITGIVYFFLFPVIAWSTGTIEFYGMTLTSLQHAHSLLLQYVLGALLAFAFNFRSLSESKLGTTRPNGAQIRGAIYRLLWVLATFGVVYQVATGRLNVTGMQQYEFMKDKVGSFSFVTQSLNLLIPLTLTLLVRRRFDLLSLFIAALVFVIFIQAGFRFRLLILACGAVIAFSLSRGIKIRLIYTFAGAAAAMYAVNILGMIRRYGQGIDLSRLQVQSGADVFTKVGGELGPVFVTAKVADSPITTYATIEPWLVGIARLVPSFVWSDKPTARYLSSFYSGLAVNADRAGIAAPQPVEMLLQFGWYGVALLSFCYFTIACALHRQSLRLTPQGRIVGVALIAPFFGYYMQTRGYFFQILADGLFIILPIFVLFPRMNARTSGLNKRES